MTEETVRKPGFETLQVHAGQRPDPTTGAIALPIYQTTAYQFDSPEQAAARFALTELGPIYTRLNNPTTEVVENRIAALEGGVGALLVASGQSATAFSIWNVADAGDHIVASGSLYGGTYNLLAHTLKKQGIDVTFIPDPLDRAQWLDAVQPNTKAFFAETITNPNGDVLDIELVADAAHSVGVPLIVDNTIPTPYLTRPFEWGADIVVHSATKYLGGHGNSVGGAIVDSGNFDFGKYPERFPHFNEPDITYNGIVYARDFGADGALGANVAYIIKARTQLLRDIGAAISPFNSFLIAQGIETLSLRVQRQSDNALAIAQFLKERPGVTSVTYAGLSDSPYNSLVKKYAPKGAGGIVSFELEGGEAAARAFLEAVELMTLVVNIGDVRSQVSYPYSTTHSQLNEEQAAVAGVTPGLVRISSGIESIEDILADIQLGLDAASEVLK